MNENKNEKNISLYGIKVITVFFITVIFSQLINSFNNNIFTSEIIGDFMSLFVVSGIFFYVIKRLYEESKIMRFILLVVVLGLFFVIPLSHFLGLIVSGNIFEINITRLIGIIIDLFIYGLLIVLLYFLKKGKTDFLQKYFIGKDEIISYFDKYYNEKNLIIYSIFFIVATYYRLNFITDFLVTILIFFGILIL